MRVANSMSIDTTAFLYQHIIKPLLFLRDPEKVHVSVLRLGQKLGNSPLAIKILGALFTHADTTLQQTFFGVQFNSPIGLSAGFDYEAKLTAILPALGFGFGTVGTLTHKSYEGNQRPMLGRLPESRALLVNKGFKNDGVAATLARLANKPLHYPMGVSIGKTNIVHASQQEAIDDIVAGFRDAEASGILFSYYELNISCPNLKGGIEFYSPSHLRELLDAVSALRLHRPIFLKMPISLTDQQTTNMLDVVVEFTCIQAIIIGNLQRDRQDPSLSSSEVAKFPVGNFSGKPCEQRSNALIGQIYRVYGTRIKIIGCGGVFSAEDAYKKIRLGASLVQLITGMIYQGPQLVAQINRDLGRMVRRDGFTSIRDAIGIDSTQK